MLPPDSDGEFDSVRCSSLTSGGLAQRRSWRSALLDGDIAPMDWRVSGQEGCFSAPLSFISASAELAAVDLAALVISAAAALSAAAAADLAADCGSGPEVLAQVEAWLKLSLEGLLLLLALAQAGHAGDLKNALLCRCSGCYVADCF